MNVLQFRQKSDQNSWGINLQTNLFKGLKKVLYFIVYFYVHTKTHFKTIWIRQTELLPEY